VFKALQEQMRRAEQNGVFAKNGENGENG